MLKGVRRRRVWTEFLPPEILGAPATVSLLKRYELQALIAMPPERDGPAMLEALQALQKTGIALGIWPLLPDWEGYWPGSENAQDSAARVRRLLAMAEAAGVRVATVAMDLEPGLPLKREMQQAGRRARVRYLGARLRVTRRREYREQHASAVREYADLVRDLRQGGIESLAIAVPPLALDLAAETDFCQRFFSTPLSGPGWDTVSPMYYRSMIQQALPGQSRLLGRALFAEACRLWARAEEPICMSLGVVGVGKFADEASYESPAELAWDVACARAHGLEDLALFSLESVLDRSNPEAWLEAFTRPAPPLAPGVGERVAGKTLRALLAGTARLTRWVAS